MSHTSPPNLKARRTLKLIEAIIGTTRIQGIAIAIALIVTLGWFTNSTFEFIPNDYKGLQTIIGLLAFPILLGVLVRVTRHSYNEVKIHVVTDENPSQTKALLLILSPPRGDDKRLLIEEHQPLEKGAPMLNNFQGWLMPMIAIAHHLGRLEHLVVIPSADRNIIDPDTRRPKAEIEGTYHMMDKFKELVKNVTKNHDIKIHALGDILPQYQKGIDVEDVNALAIAMDDTISHLKHKHNVPEYDTLIDITGGQKTPTIAGAIVALAEGRRFQYVSTHNQKVLTYDVTYE